jgi:glycine cleavage system H protein
LNIPSDRRYSHYHEWLKDDGPLATVGITAYAAAALGDVVFLGLPEVGTRVIAGDVCGEIESTKSVSDLFAPVTGEVLEVNDDAVADPSLVNSDPYDTGWLFRLRVEEAAELLNADEYGGTTDVGDGTAT